jgi:4-hydroxybenzoate polyprenyltransferase
MAEIETPPGESDFASASRVAAEVPLVVDLDGTLIAGDTLFESTLLLAKTKPWIVLNVPFWLLQGRAALKARVSGQTTLAPDSLPYRQDVLNFLSEQRASGRRIVLATAAHRNIAESVASYLGLFDDVIASDSNTNRKGDLKRAELVERYGTRGFDYIGDSRADLPVWTDCRTAHMAGSGVRFLRVVQDSGATPGRLFPGARPKLSTWIRALRCYQWVKNLLIFVPLALSHRLKLQSAAFLLAAFIAFSLLASGTYIVNDLLDLAADRRHPKKRNRPFASGVLSIPQGVAMAFFLLAVSLSSAGALGAGVLACFLTYLALTLAYSSFIKRKPIIDVVVLAVLYTLRLIVGGVAGHVFLSHWLFQFAIFLFLSLAFVKRYSELHRLKLSDPVQGKARGYYATDLDTISQAGIASGLLAALVLAMYVDSPEVRRLYARPEVLWIACPIFIYWISWIWLVARRGNMNEDPILFAFRDKTSYLVVFLMVVATLIGIVPYGN